MLTTTFTVEYTLTDTTLNVLTGQLYHGAMGEVIGFHRNIPLYGMPPNLNAQGHGPYPFGALPVIVLPIAPEAPDWQAAKYNALNRILYVLTAPDFGQVGGEWAILALARSNHVVPEGYFGGYLANIGAMVGALSETTDPNSTAPGWVYNPATGRREVRLANHQSTENARLIVALTALGVDASSFEHNGNIYDFVSRLGNRHSGTQNNMWGTNQGINGVIWPIIAINSRPYEISDRAWVGGTTASNPITIDERIEWILSNERNPGGWSLAGGPDPDMTGMALIALAPYRDRPEVNSAINRALTWLSESQTAAGGWGSWGVENVQSSAQVIVALTTLGIDPMTDQRFITANGNNPVTALLGFQDEETGGFIHGGRVDLMATEQAAYALVAYWRFVNDMNTLYDMRDAFDNNNQQPEVNRNALHAAVAAAQARTQATYTAASWTAMQTALTTAIAVRDNADATQADVDTAASTLQTAIAALAPVGGGGNNQPQPAGRVFLSVRDPNARAGQTALYFQGYLNLQPGETAYSILRRPETGLQISSRGHASLVGMYVWAINGFGEFDDGPLSGWMFSVNGVFPDYSSSLRVLSNGDRVEWLFTRDLGNDLGAGESIGGGVGGAGGSGGNAADDDEDDEDNEEDAEQATEDALTWDNPFNDIAYYNWFYNYVRFAFTNGLMNGINEDTFSPNTNLSRAMAVTILWRLENEPTAQNGTVFSDVQAGRWYSDAIAWAAENGIVNGFGDGRFGPSYYVTREQLAVILYNYAQFLDLYTGGAFAAEFDDKYSISSWALSAMRWANANGFINGRTQATLVPNGTATRAEFAAILQRFVYSQ